MSFITEGSVAHRYTPIHDIKRVGMTQRKDSLDRDFIRLKLEVVMIYFWSESCNNYLNILLSQVVHLA